MSNPHPVVRLSKISKTFGRTKALSDVSLEIRPGELVGLIGHNGAGKSTTMRTIAGEYHPDGGSVFVRGQDITSRHNAGLALDMGIRTVYQELELPGNLKIREAAVFAAPKAVGTLRGWRRRSERMIMERLQEIFPQSGIAAGQRIDRLSISQRQMLAIALAGLWPEKQPATCLILDEPTSSLDAFSAKGLYDWLRKEARQRGLGVLVSTHKLNEVVGELDRAYVMVDGQIASERPMKGTTSADLVAAMQHASASISTEKAEDVHVLSVETEGMAKASGSIAIRNLRSAGLSIDQLEINAGEIVGIGGLEGQGQKRLLRAVFAQASGYERDPSFAIKGQAAFVSGDRRTDGIFPLWNVESNLSVSCLSALSRMGLVSRLRERALVLKWHRRLRVKGTIDDPIVSLSGGTQQKVLVGRALAQIPDVLLLDDPTRGVDEQTKLEIFSLVKAQARSGTAVLWYSTETAELHRCDRVCVMNSGRIMDEILTKTADPRSFEDRVLGSSFS